MTERRDQQKIKECNASVDLEELANINPDKDIAIAKCEIIFIVFR